MGVDDFLSGIRCKMRQKIDLEDTTEVKMELVDNCFDNYFNIVLGIVTTYKEIYVTIFYDVMNCGKRRKLYNRSIGRLSFDKTSMTYIKVFFSYFLQCMKTFSQQTLI